MQKFTNHYSVKLTPQNASIPGKNQVKNNAGGYAFEITIWSLLERFLILGTEGGTYYVSEQKLTVDNASSVVKCIETDAIRTISTIVNISIDGRAIKNDAALFALAMASHFANEEGRKYAFDMLDRVARTSTHLFQFIEYRKAFGGWGRGMRRAVANWYLSKSLQKLTYQVLKYQQRDGWSHADVLKLAHPKPVDAETDELFRFILNKPFDGDLALNPLLHGFVQAKNNAEDISKLILKYKLTREMIPTESLTSTAVWEALLLGMPANALLRNLGNLGKSGVLKPFSEASGFVCARLADTKWLADNRVHPLAILVALKVYSSGASIKGHGTWTVVPQVCYALEEAFYASFKNIKSTGKRFLLGIDVSDSMTWPQSRIGGLSGITAAEAAAVMAMVTVRSEEQHYVHGFSGEFTDLGINRNSSLRDVALRVEKQTQFAARTDCAVPMLYALKNNIPVDVFVVYTDNDTWCGRVHPCQALDEYRRITGIDSKLIVCGMTATRFSIADPGSPYMLDVVGFDTATPSVISSFI